MFDLKEEESGVLTVSMSFSKAEIEAMLLAAARTKVRAVVVGVKDLKDAVTVPNGNGDVLLMAEITRESTRGGA